jgi:hypothetical protein
MDRLLVTMAVLAAGCSGFGDLPRRDSSADGEPDAAADASAEPDAPGDVVEEDVGPQDVGEEDVDVDCVDAQVPTLSPGHASGAACLSCHRMYAPLMTAAATVYPDAAGSAPVEGATVILTDATGAELRIVSTLMGNVYTAEALAFPVRAEVSLCPHHRVMPSPAASGECNSCHGFGSRIHVP